MDEELAICKKVLPFYSTRHHLIPVLQELQSKIGYLPEKVIVEVSRHLRVPASDVYAVASFYDQFRLQPLGRKRIAVCRGTACHVRGAPQILKRIEAMTNLKEGETSPDLEYTLETVGCIGCCALAPCVRVNKEVFGEMSPERVAELFDVFGEEDGNA
ncbi:MAG: NADH-quinone oxidoreductase subunit NuoE [Bacillota bacterium]|jgi:NADH-quinone oxidoreductase subunit E|nr:NADH-quinone oxidoreductase subunit NuoE [Thermoanaerobacteraceae bacterium]